MITLLAIAGVLMRYTSWTDVPLSLKAKDVAHILEVSVSTVYRLIERGELRAVRISERRLRISKDTLRRYLRGGARNSDDARMSAPSTHDNELLNLVARTTDTSLRSRYSDGVRHGWGG